ncbi:MAG: GDP-mannose 4,6-dehydratase [Chitinivibrionia bacterium]|nr:GDP-mannose 4,6-dehydratase [Chitinivibrionia bacterium]
MEKYLITGISGFVASHFVEYLDSLNDKNIEVLGISAHKLSSNFTNNLKNIRFNSIELNLMEIDKLKIAISSFSPDYIIHLAAFSSVASSWLDPSDAFVNNTNIFLNIAEIVRSQNIKCRILSVGSSEIYGNVSADEVPLKETIKTNPKSPYAIARLSQEMLSKCYADYYKTDIVITRSFNHIGPRQKDSFVISSFIKQSLEAQKLSNKIKLKTGDISIIRDFVDVRDVVRAYYLLLKKGISGEIYNICSGNGNSLANIIKQIAKILKIEIETEIDPLRIRPSDNKIIVGDYSKLKSQTDWTPKIELEKSLKDIIDYMS